AGFFSVKQAAMDAQKSVVLGVVDLAQMLRERPTKMMAASSPGPVPDALSLFSKSPMRLPTENIGSGQGVSFKFYDTLEPAEADLKAGQLRGIYKIPEDYIKTGTVAFINNSEHMLRDRPRQADEPLRRLLIENLLRDQVSDREIIRRVKSPLAVK